MENLILRYIKHLEKEPDLQHRSDEPAIDLTDLKDKFAKNLSFGTAGMRGLMESGTNRINLFTVRRAVQAYSMYLNQKFEAPTVGICYDNRHNSLFFAKAAAEVFAANKIAVKMFNEPMPTPVFSFAVRQQNLQGGIVVTASHNPAQYNGIKAYSPTGGQLLAQDGDVIERLQQELDLFNGVKYLNFTLALNAGLVQYFGEEIVENYIEHSLKLMPQKNLLCESKSKIVYTPLNGAGRSIIPQLFEAAGLKNVETVPEQMEFDGSFATCPAPSPDNEQALELAILLARRTAGEIVIATDPDADRVGMAELYAGGEHKIFTGNELGVLMLNYLLEQNAGNTFGRCFMKSVVSTNLADAVAAKHGVKTVNLLTGFKFFANYMDKMEAEGSPQPIFGFEESGGYIFSDALRDKDAVSAALLLAEMAACYKNEGRTFKEVLDELHNEHGFYLDHTQSVEFIHPNWEELAEIIMQQTLEDFSADGDVAYVYNYRSGSKTDVALAKTTPMQLPKTNMVEVEYKNGGRFMVRPSGTEPKLKIYYKFKGKNRQNAQDEFQSCFAALENWLYEIKKSNNCLV